MGFGHAIHGMAWTSVTRPIRHVVEDLDRIIGMPIGLKQATNLIAAMQPIRPILISMSQGSRTIRSLNRRHQGRAGQTNAKPINSRSLIPV